MNKKQRKTYDAIFVDPIRRNIVWDDVVNLIQSLGGIITQGDGSRVRFDLNKILPVNNSLIDYPGSRYDRNFAIAKRHCVIA
jgi:hypothetical protein